MLVFAFTKILNYHFLCSSYLLYKIALTFFISAFLFCRNVGWLHQEMNFILLYLQLEYCSGLRFDNLFLWKQMQALFRIGKGELPPIPDSLSKDARDFILQCLQVNPDDRPTAAKLLNHPFVQRPVSTLSGSASPYIRRRGWTSHLQVCSVCLFYSRPLNLYLAKMHKPSWALVIVRKNPLTLKSHEILPWSLYFVQITPFEKIKRFLVFLLLLITKIIIFNFWFILNATTIIKL